MSAYIAEAAGTRLQLDCDHRWMGCCVHHCGVRRGRINGALLNPGVTIALAAIGSFPHCQTDRPTGPTPWIPIVAPIAGGIIGAVFYTAVGS